MLAVTLQRHVRTASMLQVVTPTVDASQTVRLCRCQRGGGLLGLLGEPGPQVTQRGPRGLMVLDRVVELSQGAPVRRGHCRTHSPHLEVSNATSDAEISTVVVADPK